MTVQAWYDRLLAQGYDLSENDDETRLDILDKGGEVVASGHGSTEVERLENALEALWEHAEE